MGNFVHPALVGPLYATVIVAVSIPIIIHLINMLRHRRVEWAAMEFLLLSQKKNRTWIVLKQLLLMLLRMAAMAAVVFMVAQPLLENRWGNLFGTSNTQHIVLLDDSYSMSDRWADTSAIDEARRVVEQLGAKAADQVHAQTFTLLRFSQAGRDRQPDLLEVPVNKKDFLDKLGAKLREIKASQLSVGPLPALKAIGQLLGDAAGQRRIVYLVSDFRTRQWDDPGDVQKLLKQLSDARVELHLVNCVGEQARPNLAIAELGAAEGLQVAGVPFFMEVTVKNFGTAPVRDVPVILEEDGHARAPVTIAEIPPGKTAKERFAVYFPTAGDHQIAARLDGDAVAADNYRYTVAPLPVGIPLLLVDGAPEARDARLIGVAAAPGGSVRTGLQPQIETPRYLDLKPLDQFGTVGLLNVDRLDKTAIEAVESYVASGGGVAVFLGDRCRSKFINDELYRDGEGFFPCPLEGPSDLLVDRLERAPDVDVEDHPIFRVFSDKRNNFIAGVTVSRYFAAPAGWAPKPDSTVRILARLRNGDPLVVERKFGEGRVVAFLTSAAPVWNNWAREPSFVVMMLDLASYLAKRPAEGAGRPVGVPLELSLDPAVYQPQVRIAGPDQGIAPTTRIDATPTPDNKLGLKFAETDAAGVYQVHLTRKAGDGGMEVRHYAMNVDPAEGDLAAMTGELLADRLPGVNYEYEQASQFHYAATQQAGYNLSEALLYTLLVLLVVEQLLAWSATYHPPARHALAKGGAR